MYYHPKYRETELWRWHGAPHNLPYKSKEVFLHSLFINFSVPVRERCFWLIRSKSSFQAPEQACYTCGCFFFLKHGNIIDVCDSLIQLITHSANLWGHWLNSWLWGDNRWPLPSGAYAFLPMMTLDLTSRAIVTPNSLRQGWTWCSSSL